MHPTPSPLGPIQTDIKFLLKHPAHMIALGFGSGLSPIAPGTVGTLFAWLTFYLITQVLTFIDLSVSVTWPLIIVLSFLIGLWACHICSESMQSHDPGAIVWDEIVAFWLVLYCLLLVFPTLPFWLQFLAFTLFRLFDMIKKGPVRWADQTFKGTGYRNAFGIMLDDLVAAILAVASIYFLFLIFNTVTHA